MLLARSGHCSNSVAVAWLGMLLPALTTQRLVTLAKGEHDLRYELANEFVDALPVDQFVKDRGWHLRMVGLANQELAFVVAPDPMPGTGSVEAAAGTILERRQDGAIASLARRIARGGGGALVIDRGAARVSESSLPRR